MPWTFDRIVEIQPSVTSNTWQVRYLRTNSDSGEQESDYVKYSSSQRPQAADLVPLISQQLQAKNNVPNHPEVLFPESAPVINGLTAGQQVTLNNIWNLLKIWIRQFLGRR
jgi:hypothetical protein